MIHVYVENSGNFQKFYVKNFLYLKKENLDWLEMINWKIIFLPPPY